MSHKLKTFIYKFNDGPVSTAEELLSDWNTGNCRRAVQYYIFNKKDIFLKPDEVLCPKAYNEIGDFVLTKDEEFNFDSILNGDIIYAEKIRNKEGNLIDRSLPSFPAENDYIVALHTALFTGVKDEEIWHATAVEGTSCFWSLDKFLKFYKPVAAKRIKASIA